jgi:hypothetical protein
MEANQMTPNNLTRIQEIIRQFSECYSSRISSIAHDLSQMALDTSKLQELVAGWNLALSKIQPLPDIDHLYQKWDDSCRRLAELGWTIPMHFTPREMVELTAPTNTDQDIENDIVDFYTCDQHKQLRRLQDDLMTSNELAQWHPLLRQCFIAFDSNLHLVTVPSLISALEGVVAQKCNTLRTKNIRMIQPTRDKAAQAIPLSMERLIWKSVATFMEKLYENSDFSGNRPFLINRHWILHGRDATAWTVADSIRLFNALQTIV